MHLLVLIWEASQSITEIPLNSKIYKQPKCPEWRLQSTQPQTEHVYCHFFLLRLQGYLLKRVWKECTSRGCTVHWLQGNSVFWTHQDKCTSVIPEVGKATQNPSQPQPTKCQNRHDSLAWNHMPNPEAIVNTSCCEGQRPFSHIVSSLVRWLCSSGSPHIQGYFNSTNFWSQWVRIDLRRAEGEARMWWKHAVWYSQRTIKRHSCPADVYSKTKYTREGMIREDEGARGGGKRVVKPTWSKCCMYVWKWHKEASYFVWFMLIHVFEKRYCYVFHARMECHSLQFYPPECWDYRVCCLQL